MVTDFYGLREEPFGATPDSRFLYESQTHREALASLLYGAQAGRGFMALIAKPGMGKTTLLFRGLGQLREKGRTVFLFQSIQTPLDLLRTLLADLGVQDLQGGLFELQSKLNEILVDYSRRGERLVVVIDETQNLDDSVLELLRMLSNFETQQNKLMQIVLSGQPQLARKLASPNLLQLRQRISTIAQLRAFSDEETEQYIEHRLRVAGYGFEQPLFTRSAVQMIAQHSGGIPRNINTLCFNAISIGCALKCRTINADIVREAIEDLDLSPLSHLADEPETRHARKMAAPPPRGQLLTFSGWAAKAALASVLLLLLSGVTIPVGSRATVLADMRGPTIARVSRPARAPIAATRKSVRASVPEPAAASAPTTHSLQIDAEDRILVPAGVTPIRFAPRR